MPTTAVQVPPIPSQNVPIIRADGRMDPDWYAVIDFALKALRTLRSEASYASATAIADISTTSGVLTTAERQKFNLILAAIRVPKIIGT